MSIDTLPIFSALKTKMSFLSTRAKVLAQNIANVDTPEYRAKDLKAMSFDDLVKSAEKSSAPGLRVTHERHLEGGGGATAAPFKEDENEVDFVGINGNTVSIQEEMVKSSQTQMDYAMATGLYRKSLNMMRIALGRNQ